MVKVNRLGFYGKQKSDIFGLPESRSTSTTCLVCATFIEVALHMYIFIFFQMLFFLIFFSRTNTKSFETVEVSETFYTSFTTSFLWFSLCNHVHCLFFLLFLSSVKTKEHLEKPTKPEKPEKQNKKKTPEISAVTSVCAATAPAPTPTVTTSSNTRREPLTPDTSADALGTNHTVQVFINHSCVPGPFLDVAKVACLPSCFRGTVPNVARDCFQSIVNAGIEPANVFRVFKQGNGKTRITCKNGKQTLSCHLQVMDRVSRFWSVLDKLAENLQCCVNLFSGERIAGLCSKCGRNGKTQDP